MLNNHIHKSFNIAIAIKQGNTTIQNKAKRLRATTFSIAKLEEK